MKLAEIAKYQVITLAPEDSIDHALALMVEHDFHHLPVVEKGRPVGMISDRDLLSFVGNPDNHAAGEAAPSRVEQIMSKPVHALSPRDSIKNACELMVSKRIHSVPLVLYDHIKGIVTTTDLLRLYIDPRVVGDSGSWRGRKVGDHMNRAPFTLMPESTLLDAINLMRDREIRHVPITAGEELVGIVSDRDVRLALGTGARQDEPPVDRRKHAQWPLREVMRHPVETTAPAVKLDRIAERMLTRKISALPVLDGGKLVGIVTDTNLLEALVESDAL